jgi:hypothetical protein
MTPDKERGMTKEEHDLMLMMFVQQAITVKAFEKILKSSGLVTDETLRGIHESVEYEESENPDLIPRTEEFYRKMAKKLGVDFPE